MIGLELMKLCFRSLCIIAMVTSSFSLAVNIELGVDSVFVLPFKYHIDYYDTPSSPAQTTLKTKPSGLGLGGFLAIEFMDQHRILMRYQGTKLKGEKKENTSSSRVIETFTSTYHQTRLDFDILLDLGSKSRWVIGFDLGYIWLNTQNIEVNTLPFSLPQEINTNHKFFGVGLHTGFEVKYDFLYFGLYLHKTLRSENLDTPSHSTPTGQYEIHAPQPLVLSTSIGFVL